MTYTDTQTKLIPLVTPPAGIISVAKAYAAILRDGMFQASPGDVSGVMEAALYSYFNGSHGSIQADGSVELDYQGTAVWVFAAKMRSGYQPAYAGGSQINPATTFDEHPSPGACTYVVLVDAHTGVSITAGAECTGATG